MKLATVVLAILGATLVANVGVNGQSVLDAFAMGAGTAGYGDFTPIDNTNTALKLKGSARQSTSTIQVSDLSPFCNVKRQRDPGPYKAENCALWAEHEVDMVLMLLDLISERVPSDVAVKFYGEIACLSRSNLFFDNKKKVWQVCFSQDYSKTVGQLLAKYVEPVFAELDLEGAGANVINPAARFANIVDVVKNVNIDAVVRNEEAVQAALAAAKNSGTADCCKDCASSRYFVFFSYDMCVNKPSGAHCCHKVCQSLERIKIGMSASTSYCCPDLYPQVCIM